MLQSVTHLQIFHKKNAGIVCPAFVFSVYSIGNVVSGHTDQPENTENDMSFENQIKEILKARLEGTATEEELAILREWLDRSPQNRELAELLEESAENLPLLGRIYGYDEQRVWGNIRKAARRRRMRMLAATARKYAAAAGGRSAAGPNGSHGRLTSSS